MPNHLQLNTHPQPANFINAVIVAGYFLLLTALTGCAGFVPATAQSTAPLIQRSYAQKIDITGRLSAQYDSLNGPQSIHINFTWSQTPEQTLISLGSPTGQTIATILINDQGALLTQTDKPPRSANDPNQLFQDMLGWPLPIGGLRDWLQGFTNPDHQRVINQTEADQAFKADGWDLRYPNWQIEQNSARPKRLDLSRQTEQAGLVSLRIVMDEWSVQP
jgi:outer membrane lipoprotein LolB